MKQFRKTIALCVALLCGAWPGFAQNAEVKPAIPAADPDEVLRAALPENVLPDLKAILAAAMANAPRVIDSGLNVDQSDTSVQSSRAQMLPRAYLNASPGLVYQKYQYEDQAPHTTNSVSLYYSAGVSQPIYHWGAIYKSFQSARLQKAISERNLSEVRRALVSDVRRNYFSLISATNARVVEQKKLKTLESDYEYLSAQAKDGFVTQSVASSAEGLLLNHKEQIRRTQNNYESQWRAFRQLTGDDSLRPTTPLPEEIPPVDKKVGEILDALSQGYGDYVPADLANANDRVKVEQLSYDITKTRLRPQVDLSLGASQQNQHAGGDESKPPALTRTYGAYLNVNWTLFDGLATRAAKRSAMISLRKAKISRDQTERDSEENLRTQVQTLRMNWKNLQDAEVGLTSARDSVEIYKKDYEAGLATRKPWDDAIVLLDAAIAAANNARADYYIQIVNYLSLRGKDPAINYRPEPKPSDAPKN